MPIPGDSRAVAASGRSGGKHGATRPGAFKTQTPEIDLSVPHTKCSQCGIWSRNGRCPECGTVKAALDAKLAP